MGLLQHARKTARRMALGPDDLPQQCIVGIREPQDEIAVELHGLGMPRDVTHCHTLACAAPFTVCIGLEKGAGAELRANRLALHFRELGASRPVLGSLGLRPAVILPLDRADACCFTLSRCRNRCLPPIRLWARYLHWSYLRWRRPPGIPMTMRDAAAMPIFFICPRPVALASAAENIFPMNLMGPLGGAYFGFALNSSRASAAVVRRAGRLALSTVPLEHAAVARGLGPNHKRDTVRWNELPFPTMPSPTLGLRVPCFASRVRELELLTTRDLGSHTFFLARVLDDEVRADGLQFFMVHGLYQAWRQKMRFKPAAGPALGPLTGPADPAQ